MIVRSRVAIPCTTLVMLAGCTTPAVQFAAAPRATLDAQGNRAATDVGTATKKADSGAVYFDVPTTKMTFSPKAGWTDIAALDPFTMGVTPLDSDQGFYVTPKSKLFQSKFFSFATTSLTLAPLPNTNIPATINVTVTDSAQELIQTAASIAGAIPKLGAAGGPPAVAGSPTEFSLNLPDTKAALPATPQPIPNFPAGWTWQIWLDDPTAADAIRLTDFTTVTATGSFVAYFPFPACRSLKVEITTPGGFHHDYYAQVGTPEWVEPIGIPANGKITAGSYCGASATPGSTDPLNSLKDVATAITQAASVIGTPATAAAAKPAASPASNSK